MVPPWFESAASCGPRTRFLRFGSCVNLNALAVGGQVHLRRAAVGQLPGQDPPGELVGDVLLDQTLQRAGAEGRVVTPSREESPRFRSPGQLDASVGDRARKALELNLDDLLDLLPRQPVEHDHIVDT